MVRNRRERRPSEFSRNKIVDMPVPLRYQTAMVSRAFILAVACWALQISPALCLAGVLSHPCDARIENESAPPSFSASDHDHTESESGTCTHETNCGSDPCQDGPVVKDGSNRALGIVTAQVALPAINSPKTLRVQLESRADLRGSSNRPHLSFHQSDLPLLI